MPVLRNFILTCLDKVKIWLHGIPGVTVGGICLGILLIILCTKYLWFYMCKLGISNHCEYGTARTKKKKFEFLIVYFYKSNQNVNFCHREIASVCQHNFIFSLRV